jgi:hypothetical protein
MSRKRAKKPDTPQTMGEAREILCRFVVRARRVASHSMVKDGSYRKYATGNMILKYVEGGQPSIKHELPVDQEVFESLASRLRPCIVRSEPIFLGKVFASLDLLIGGRHITDEQKQLLDEHRRRFGQLSEKKDGVSYTVQTFDPDGTPTTDRLSDLLIGDAWMYGDLVHADPHAEKAEAMRLSYNERYQAATMFFSQLTQIVVDLLALVTDLNTQLEFDLEATAWSEQVDVSDEQTTIPITMPYAFPQGTVIPEGTDPSQIPGAVQLTMINALWMSNPGQRAVVVFKHSGGSSGQLFRGMYSYEDGVLNVLFNDALLLQGEVDLHRYGQLPDATAFKLTVRPFKHDPKSVDQALDAFENADEFTLILSWNEGGLQLGGPIQMIRDCVNGDNARTESASEQVDSSISGAGSTAE